MEAIYHFAKMIGDRKRARAAAGLPPEPIPTREEVTASMVATLMKPNALLARLASKSNPAPQSDTGSLAD